MIDIRAEWSAARIGAQSPRALHLGPLPSLWQRPACSSPLATGQNARYSIGSAGTFPCRIGENRMPDHAAIIARLESLAAEPKPWLATIFLADGSTRTHRQPRREMAIAYAERLAGKAHFVRAVVEYAPE